MMNEKNNETIKEEDVRLQVIVGVAIVAVIAAKLIRTDINRRPIVNNFYIIDDKIIPFRFR